jgi:hypothetical protein
MIPLQLIDLLGLKQCITNNTLSETRRFWWHISLSVIPPDTFQYLGPKVLARTPPSRGQSLPIRFVRGTYSLACRSLYTSTLHETYSDCCQIEECSMCFGTVSVHGLNYTSKPYMNLTSGCVARLQHCAVHVLHYRHNPYTNLTTLHCKGLIRTLVRAEKPPI